MVIYDKFFISYDKYIIVFYSYLAGVYAHTAYRNWESDTSVIKNKLDPQECEDIAHQLIYGQTGRNLHVIMGGGRKKFFSKNKKDQKGKRGDRSDQKDLIQEWTNMKKAEGVKSQYVWNRDQLFNVDNDTEYLLGMLIINIINALFYILSKYTYANCRFLSWLILIFYC